MKQPMAVAVMMMMVVLIVIAIVKEVTKFSQNASVAWHPINHTGN
jgi:hypothetical protein